MEERSTSCDLMVVRSRSCVSIGNIFDRREERIESEESDARVVEQAAADLVDVRAES